MGAAARIGTALGIRIFHNDSGGHAPRDAAALQQALANLA